MCVAAQIAPLPIGMFTEDVELLLHEDHPEAREAFGTSIGVISGLSRSAGGAFNVAVVQTAILADDETPHYVLDLGGWPDDMAGRALFMAAFAILYETVLVNPRWKMARVKDHVLEMLAGLQADTGPQVDLATNLRYNWLPFDDDEADYMAFGTKVSRDSLPAVAWAVRRQQPGFHIAADADLRLVLRD